MNTQMWLALLGLLAGALAGALQEAKRRRHGEPPRKSQDGDQD